MSRFFETLRDFAYTQHFTEHSTYGFPFQAVTIKSNLTGGHTEANIVQLTKSLAWHQVDRVWWKFRGPFVPKPIEDGDENWKWYSLVRRHRKEEWCRCVALRTSDGEVQGAAIYTRDGRSLLEPDKSAIYLYFLATAPANRRTYAKKPKYLMVGESLVTLIAAHSYQWGMDGRIVLNSLPRAIGFYKKLGFVETQTETERKIHYELPPEPATRLLEKGGII